MEPLCENWRSKGMQKPQLFKHSARELNRKLKATVQKNLNLGFTTDAIAALKLREEMGIILLTEGEIPTRNVVYMKLIHDYRTDEDAFRVNKAGNYCYANTKKFFKKLFKGLGLEPTVSNVIYDLAEIDFDGEKYWEMTGREVDEKEIEDDRESGN